MKTAVPQPPSIDAIFELVAHEQLDVWTSLSHIGRLSYSTKVRRVCVANVLYIIGVVEMVALLSDANGSFKQQVYSVEHMTVGVRL